MEALEFTPAAPPIRIPRRDDTWTIREVEILHKHWPDIDCIAKLLPHRTRKAISRKAEKCRLGPKREQHIWTAREDKILRQMVAASASRQEVADKLGLTARQVNNRMITARIKRKPLPPKAVRNPLAHAIRQRAFEMRIPLKDLDRSLGRKKRFSDTCYCVGASPAAIAKAVSALGGTLRIDWEPLH